jgi:hypothetical protein
MLVLVTCVLVFTVFYIVCTVFLVLLCLCVRFLTCYVCIATEWYYSIAVSSNNNNNNNHNTFFRKSYLLWTVWKYSSRAMQATKRYIHKTRRTQDTIWLPVTKVRTHRHSLTVFNACCPHYLSITTDFVKRFTETHTKPENMRHDLSVIKICLAKSHV